MSTQSLVHNLRHRPRRRAQPVRALVTWLLVLLAALVWATPARAQGALPGSYAPAPCPFGTIANLRIDCGYLTVAESRRPVSNRTIQLAVATLRSPNPNKAADPVLFLSGGPGQPALPEIALFAVAYALVLAQHDIIFIDQRGTGYSTPALNCPAGAVSGGQFASGAQADQRPKVLQTAVDAFFNEAMLDICSAWELHAASAAQNRPVQSDIPALIISGEFDPITPPQNAADTASNLNRSFVISYPRGGDTPSATKPMSRRRDRGLSCQPSAAARYLVYCRPSPHAIPGCALRQDSNNWLSPSQSAQTLTPSLRRHPLFQLGKGGWG